MQIAPRRFLPSLSLLAAFEAVCRLGSTSSAARELALSQGAVSRLVQNLEGQLSVQLFRRERKRLVPTDAALTYMGDIQKALSLIATSSLSLRVNPAGGTLSLAILPTLGTRWLAPRLPDFLAHHPGVTINLGTRIDRFNFEHERFDAALRFRDADWPDTEKLKLFDDAMIACCAPGFRTSLPASEASDLLSMPLLHLESRPTAWATWFQRQHCDGIAVQGMLFDQFATVLQAAIHGMGVALLPAFLASGEIQAGRLVRAHNFVLSDVGAYHLIWPSARSNFLPLQAFCRWIEAQAADMRNPPL